MLTCLPMALTHKINTIHSITMKRPNIPIQNRTKTSSCPTNPN